MLIWPDNRKNLTLISGSLWSNLGDFNKEE
jgi:hypothetical protein